MSWRTFARKSETRDGREWVWVATSDWREAHVELSEAGFARLEYLTAFDDGGVHLVSAVADAPCVEVVNVVCGPSDAFQPLDDLFQSASWHQREVAQMFGVSFPGSRDIREAFEGAFDGHPLRRTSKLDARLDRGWPGAFEPDESARRRPSPPPGVTLEWQQ